MTRYMRALGAEELVRGEQAGGDQQHVLVVIVDQTLHPDSVDGSQQRSLPTVPENERETAAEFPNETRTGSIIEGGQEGSRSDSIREPAPPARGELALTAFANHRR